ncbi:hypothetical protein [Dactylosporangium darangshiense]|uniref:hypothetical protein n=1 Tax=Dactylosporangium darangshiense TaxID=579108 RepID=UPI00362D6158
MSPAVTTRPSGAVVPAATRLASIRSGCSRTASTRVAGLAGAAGGSGRRSSSSSAMSRASTASSSDSVTSCNRLSSQLPPGSPVVLSSASGVQVRPPLTSTPEPAVHHSRAPAWRYRGETGVCTSNSPASSSATHRPTGSQRTPGGSSSRVRAAPTLRAISPSARPAGSNSGAATPSRSAPDGNGSCSKIGTRSLVSSSGSSASAACGRAVSSFATAASRSTPAGSIHSWSGSRCSHSARSVISVGTVAPSTVRCVHASALRCQPSGVASPEPIDTVAAVGDAEMTRRGRNAPPDRHTTGTGSTSRTGLPPSPSAAPVLAPWCSGAPAASYRMVTRAPPLAPAGGMPRQKPGRSCG